MLLQLLLLLLLLLWLLQLLLLLLLLLLWLLQLLLLATVGTTAVEPLDHPGPSWVVAMEGRARHPDGRMAEMMVLGGSAGGVVGMLFTP